MNSNLLLKSLKNKDRFQSAKGNLTAEQLFDLNLTQLDEVAQGIDEQLDTKERRSFVKHRYDPEKARLRRALEVVKLVIQVKLEDSDAAEKAEAKRQLKAKLESAIERKNDQNLEDASLEDLKKQLAEL